MTQEQYDERDRLTAEHERLKEEMDGVRDHFIATAAEELPDRWDRLVRFWISNHPEEAKKLGTDGLREIRSEIRALAPRANEIARTHLSGEKVWLHERTEGVYPSGGRPQYQPTGSTANVWMHVSKPLMDAENEIVPLLQRHFQRDAGRRGWDGAPLSPQLVEIIETYADLHRKLKDVGDQLRALNRQIESAEALSLWDDVKDEQ